MGGIIWLASFPKSGNTWTRLFLSNLFANSREPVSINDLRYTTSDPKQETYERVHGGPIAGLSADRLRALTPKVHHFIARSRPDAVFVKTHSFLGEENGAPLITMSVTAGAVYIVRNPLDVVASMARHYGLTIDQAVESLNNPKFHGGRAHQTIIERYSSWHNHVRSWSLEGHKNLHVMRYEDMLDAPLKTFGALARFLGLDPPRERLKRAIKFSSFRVLRRQEERDGFSERTDHAERFFAVGRAGQWRTELTPEQIERVVAVNREQMERFGYVP